MEIIKTYPNFKFKALTFSFDDGCFEDLEVTNYFRKLNIKGTFNLNSNNMDGTHVFNTWGWLDVRRIDKKIAKDIYKGFEVAGHASTHLDLTKANLKNQVAKDLKRLKKIFGYKIEGFAYPYGTYNDKVIEYLKSQDVLYARAIKTTKNFNIPSDWFTFGGNVEISEPEYLKMIKEYIELNENKMSLLYVWGHTYELNLMHSHDSFYKSLEYIANKDDIFYATNIEIVKYLNALDSLIINNNSIENKSLIDLYLIIDGKNTIIKSKSKITF